MRLDEERVRALLRSLARTSDRELDCLATGARLATLVEREGEAPLDDPAERELVRHHLALCLHCRQELTALRTAIDESDEIAASGLVD